MSNFELKFFLFNSKIQKIIKTIFWLKKKKKKDLGGVEEATRLGKDFIVLLT